jgi:hypothetical protein
MPWSAEPLELLTMLLLLLLEVVKATRVWNRAIRADADEAR